MKSKFGVVVAGMKRCPFPTPPSQGGFGIDDCALPSPA